VAFRGLGSGYEGHNSRYICTLSCQCEGRLLVQSVNTAWEAAPEILIIAIPARPGAVERAYIVSSYAVELRLEL
jgi:hypothetical protein